MTTRSQQLRSFLARPGITVVPGCHDAIGARLIREAGYDAAYMSGFCVAASHGKPDVGLLTMSEMVERAAQIADAVDIPVIADADTGYGGLPNVARTVQAFERAGIAGLHLEDQVTPKKCGAMAGKQLVSIPEMTERIRVARHARRDPDFVVIGRTDAVATHGLDEAIRRGRALEEAGADAVMVMSLATVEEMTRVRAALRGPVIVLMSETIRQLHPVSKLRELGFSVVIYPLTLILRAAGAQREILAALKQEGNTERFVPAMVPFGEMNRLAGLPEVVALEEMFAAKGA